MDALIEDGKEAVVKANPYDALVPQAVAELERILHFTDDEKLRAKVAGDIIAASSQGKQNEPVPTIIISQSNVQLLLQTMKEVNG